MALASAIITSGRYDLRDTNINQYEDPELLDYLNRSLVQLDAALLALSSDWLHASDLSSTLSSGTDSVTAPTRCLSIRSLWIGTNQKTQKSPDVIEYKSQFISSTGEPSFFALQGANIIFERTADDDYTLKNYYNRYASTLETSSTMPYSSQFDQELRQGMVLAAKARQERATDIDGLLLDYFTEAAANKAMKRQFKPKPYRLGF